MRSHKGLRPHDILLVLKLSHAADLRQTALAKDLFMSQSEVSDSLGRSYVSGFINESKQIVYKNNLLEFLIYGVKYVFPAIPGSIQKGIGTGHSASPLDAYISADKHYVWPYYKGDLLGESIAPFHKNQHLAALQDPELYQKLALVDAIRMRNPREGEIAKDLLGIMILGGE